MRRYQHERHHVHPTRILSTEKLPDERHELGKGSPKEDVPGTDPGGPAHLRERRPHLLRQRSPEQLRTLVHRKRDAGGVPVQLRQRDPQRHCELSGVEYEQVGSDRH